MAQEYQMCMRCYLHSTITHPQMAPQNPLGFPNQDLVMGGCGTAMMLMVYI